MDKLKFVLIVALLVWSSPGTAGQYITPDSSRISADNSLTFSGPDITIIGQNYTNYTISISGDDNVTIRDSIITELSIQAGENVVIENTTIGHLSLASSQVTEISDSHIDDFYHAATGPLLLNSSTAVSADGIAGSGSIIDRVTSSNFSLRVDHGLISDLVMQVDSSLNYLELKGTNLTASGISTTGPAVGNFSLLASSSQLSDLDLSGLRLVEFRPVGSTIVGLRINEVLEGTVIDLDNSTLSSSSITAPAMTTMNLANRSTVEHMELVGFETVLLGDGNVVRNTLFDLGTWKLVGGPKNIITENDFYLQLGYSTLEGGVESAFRNNFVFAQYYSHLVQLAPGLDHVSNNVTLPFQEPFLYNISSSAVLGHNISFVIYTTTRERIKTNLPIDFTIEATEFSSKVSTEVYVTRIVGPYYMVSFSTSTLGITWRQDPYDANVTIVYISEKGVRRTEKRTIVIEAETDPPELSHTIPELQQYEGRQAIDPVRFNVTEPTPFTVIIGRTMDLEADPEIVYVEESQAAIDRQFSHTVDPLSLSKGVWYYVILVIDQAENQASYGFVIEITSDVTTSTSSASTGPFQSTQSLPTQERVTETSSDSFLPYPAFSLILLPITTFFYRHLRREYGSTFC